MPTYHYTCPSCHWDGDRFGVRMLERDTQICGQTVVEPTPEVLDKQPTSFAQEMKDGVLRWLCIVPLEREEIPEAKHLIIDTKSHYESKAMLKGGATISGTFGGTHNPQKRGYNQRSKS